MRILSCPYHLNSDLDTEINRAEGGNILEGSMKCLVCGRFFPIIDGIPYLLPDDLTKNCRNRDRTDSWKTGPRGWKPDLLSKLISGLSKKYPGRKREEDLFCLNIGCGERIEPGVNIDVYIPQNVPENFILASAEYLPFKENSFDIVRSSYVIEHLVNPAEFIKRQVAISKDKVVMITDNSEWLGDLWFRLVNNGRIFHDEHYYRWTVEYLKNLLTRLGFNSRVVACNLSLSYIVGALSKLGKIPRIGVWFYRDICAEIFKNRRLQEGSHD